MSMFKLKINPSYFHHVVVEFPSDKGKTVKLSFEAEFKRLTQTELDDSAEQIRNGELTDAMLVEQVFVGWKGISDEDGVALEFTETTRDQLLDMFPVRPSVIKAFYESIGGAKVKN